MIASDNPARKTLRLPREVLPSSICGELRDVLPQRVLPREVLPTLILKLGFSRI